MQEKYKLWLEFARINPKDLIRMEELKDRLRRFRKTNNLTQTEVASLLNLSDVGYGDYERGKSTPDIYSIIKLAKLYKVSTDVLLGVNQHEGISNSDVETIENAISSLKSILNKIKEG